MICKTDSSYVFESVEELSIHFHKIDLRRASSYIPTPLWLEVKKATINKKNKKDNFCFAYAATIAIYHKEIGKSLYRFSNKLIEYTEKFHCNGIDFPASTPDYKRSQKNIEDIALNIFYVPFDNEIIDVNPEYISKFNFARKKQIV